MTMAEETATCFARLEERMKTQHAKSVTRISNQARHHTSQIASVHERLDNISIEGAKREVRLISFMLGAAALTTTILGILITIPD